MLAAGRQQMVERAVRCFQSQSYSERQLLILDNGAEPLRIVQGDGIYSERTEPSSIGSLRNEAAYYAGSGCLDCDIIAHFDSDDWSHPERLTEQVKLLEESGKQAVGYRACLFFDTSQQSDYGHGLAEHECECEDCLGAAWFYSHPSPRYCIGSSLMYWRETWERKPFPDTSYGEDTAWLRNIDSQGEPIFNADPRMICAIHGGNTCSKIEPDSPQWWRAEPWDAFCRERMAL